MKVLLLARQAGMDLRTIRYVAFDGGGDRVTGMRGDRAAGLVLLAGAAAIATEARSFDVHFLLVLMTGFGAVGYLLRKLEFPLAPVILGLVLGPLMEKNLRRALSLSGGDWGVLFSSKLAMALWALAIVFLFLPPVLSRFAVARKVEASAGGVG